MDKNYYESISSLKYVANKSLGQNFLINESTCLRICNLLDISDDNKVLEIGGGLGSLTYILGSFKSNTTVIDVDENMISFLSNQFIDNNNVIVKRQNILKMDIEDYDKIIGNLPYYITSSIMEHILINAKSAKKIVLMTQKEFVEKISYKSKEVFPLKLLLHYLYTLKIEFNVGRSNFLPVPHVDSTVFTLTPKTNVEENDIKSIYKIMSRMFIHKRKTIENNLSNYIGDKKVAQDILNDMEVVLNKRPEQLSIDFYISLTNQLKLRHLIDKI